MAMQKLRGGDAFIRLLHEEGVTHLFGNPGTTELGIMEAVPQCPGLEFVLGLQEASVLAMADGFARASGRLAACNLHAAPGLGNAMGALYNAKFSGSPVVVSAGQQETGHGLQEPMLYEPLVRVAEPLVKWAVEVPRLADLPRLVHRAAKVALTEPRGPVFLSLPGDVMDAVAELDLGQPTRVEQRVRPADDVLERLALRLLCAQRPVIIAGREVANGDAFAELARLAELLGAGVFHEPVPYNARFDTEHPAFLGDLTRKQETARALLQPFDVVVCVGADLLRMSVHSAIDPLPEGMPVVHLSNRDWELGKNHATELAICADVKETLRALLPLIEQRRPAAQAQAARQRLAALAERNWRRRADTARAQLQSQPAPARIDAATLMMALAEALPREAIVVEEALTAAPALATFVPARTPTSWYGLASGGLGFALPGAVGIALAQPGRPVVAVVGDGSAMYGVQALWTAAQQQLPITYVIVNNGGYRILQERLLARGRSRSLVGMEFGAPIDFAAIARGFGLHATRVEDPSHLRGALNEAIASGRPGLLDVAVAGLPRP
jgi:benzoylformate decarboxylase